MKTAIKDAITHELKAIQDIAAKAEEANRDLTGEERGEIEQRMAKASAMRQRAKDQADLDQQLADLSGGVGLLPAQAKSAPEMFADVTGGASLGDAFLGSAEWKSLIASVPDGRFGEKMRVQSQPWGAKSLGRRGQKALITGASDTSAGALVRPDYLGLLDPYYQRPLTIRDLVTPGRTTSDVIEYVRLVSVTNAAAPVAEATTSAVIGSGDPAITTVQGGLKPESSLVTEKAETTVKTIAHWMAATKRSLSDAGQVRTLVDGFLLYGLDEELEDQMVSGSGSGENLRGITNTSGIQAQNAPGAGQDIFTVTRMARRKVRIGGRAIPTAYVFNPIDWEQIELMRDENGQFYGGGPFGNAPSRLWGLPVVESEAVPAGTGWCADWKKAVLWDREQASIQVTDAHADFFIRNLVAFLAEMRAAFAVLRPPAFCKITMPTWP